MCAEQRRRQTMSELAAYQKTCKSQSPQDHSILPSEGHRSHQSCDDSSKSSSIQLNTNCLSRTHLNPFGFFIAFITRFPVHTKLAPVKNDLIQKDGKGLQRIMDEESTPVHNYHSHHNKRSPLHFTPLSLWPHSGLKAMVTLAWTRCTKTKGKMQHIILCLPWKSNSNVMH